MFVIFKTSIKDFAFNTNMIHKCTLVVSNRYSNLNDKNFTYENYEEKLFNWCKHCMVFLLYKVFRQLYIWYT